MRREMTPAENRLWQHLRKNQVDGFHFRRQVVIEGFIVDFYCPSKLLVVEVDGDIHDLQFDYDRERTEILTQAGLRIVRFQNEEVVRNVFEVLESIKASLRPE
jgi:very-short-patch-repair endonuclease